MSQWNKKNLAFVMVSGGYKYDGFTKEGYHVFSPYVKTGLFLRLLREICFRLPFLPKKIWYNRKIITENLKYIIVFDALITSHYLRWLKGIFPDTKIFFKYENMVGKARHLLPNEIPSDIQIWTYDGYDSEKYHINCYKNYIYFQAFVRPRKDPEYDVFYVGRDKGRGEYLLKLEKEMKKLGLKTKFIITSDGRFASKKPYHQNELNYMEIVDYLTKSRAVLNVVMENQHGVTLRDAEAVFFNLKLITTNSHIIHADFYSPDRVFILGEGDMDELKGFVREKAVPVDVDLLKKHSISGMIDEITNDFVHI